MIDKARRNFTQAGHLQQSDPAEWQKLQEVEMHLGRSTDARKIGDWKSALREADAAIAAGADSSQLVMTDLSMVYVFLCSAQNVAILIFWLWNSY
jgi:DnaJ family protein C protein 7